MLNKLLSQVPNASDHGIHIDQMLEFVHWKMLILFVGWSIFLVYVLFRFHQSRNPRANYYGAKTKITTHLEISVVIVEAMLLIGFAFPLWAARVNQFPVEQAERVRVTAQQFNFIFHYPGEDKRFGPQDIGLLDASNPVGLDRSHPAGADDIVLTNEMHLPVNKPAILEIMAKDVIHNVTIHAMRVGQDAIPGQMIPAWFTPVRTGEFEIICGQLCGLGHYAMRGLLTVDTAEEYATWKEGVTALIPKPQAPATDAPNIATPPAPQGETATSPGGPERISVPAADGGTTKEPEEQPLPQVEGAAPSGQQPSAEPAPTSTPSTPPASSAPAAEA